MFSQAGYSLGLHSPVGSNVSQVSPRARDVGVMQECRSHTAWLLGLVLEVGDIGFAALVRHGVVSAPLGGDPAEVAARVFALSIVAHGDDDGSVPGGEKGSRGLWWLGWWVVEQEPEREVRLCGRWCSVDEQWYERSDVGGEKRDIWGRAGEVMGAMFVFKPWGGRGEEGRDLVGTYVRLPGGSAWYPRRKLSVLDCPRNPVRPSMHHPDSLRRTW